MQRNVEKVVGPWELRETLGVGAWTKVKVAVHSSTGQKAAVKIISKDRLAENSVLRRNSEREIALMKLMEHPNVVHLLDVFETEDKLFLIMELIDGGNLLDYIYNEKGGRLPVDEALVFFQQLVDALDYCHRHLICHRDLKPENCLLDNKGQLKLCDFGLSTLMINDRMLQTRCGTPQYCSPEVIQGTAYDGTASDIWSLGINLFVMVTGEWPFHDENTQRLFHKITSCDYDIPDYVPDEVADLIRKLLVLRPSERPTISQIKRHPWFSKIPFESSMPKINYPDPEAPIEDIDPKIAESLKYLGFHEDDLTERLRSDQKDISKVFYRLLLRKKRKPSLEAFSLTFLEKYSSSVSLPEENHKRENKPSHETGETAASEDESRERSSSVQHEALKSLDKALNSITRLNSVPKGPFDLRICPTPYSPSRSQQRVQSTNSDNSPRATARPEEKGLHSRSQSASPLGRSEHSTLGGFLKRASNRQSRDQRKNVVRQPEPSNEDIEKLAAVIARSNFRASSFRGDLRIRPGDYRTKKQDLPTQDGVYFISKLPLRKAATLSIPLLKTRLSQLFGPCELKACNSSGEVVPLASDSELIAICDNNGVVVVDACKSNENVKVNLDADVMRVLEHANAKQLSDTFAQHSIDSAVVKLLTREDLKDMGITSVGVIRKILNSIQMVFPREQDVAQET